MADLWFLVLMVVAVFVCMAVLAVACLQCRNKGPLVSIRQANTSEESSEFRVIHPTQSTIERNPIHPQTGLLSPYPPSADPLTQRRHPSFTPTETESNPSYENPPDGSNYVSGDSDAEDAGYIIVLPEGEAPLTNHSRASTPSSDVRHDYENVPEKKDPPSVRHSPTRLSAEGDEEDREYLNVDPMKTSPSQTDSESESEDDEGNYVNVNNGTPSA
uniref:uncharacterized protein LOC124073459 isoform X1 n=1 Tax=Scatophagus argus TaxID=75038 RepID=UPI001ED7F556|nr:uncharacterized protein LOC124073459 isoform X1 [Scatophagus argus]